MHLSTNSSHDAQSDTSITAATSKSTAEDGGMDSTLESISPQEGEAAASWLKWHAAFKGILPVYIAIHVGIFATSSLAFLFTVPDFSTTAQPIATLWQQWHYWDSSNFTHIALHGYYQLILTAFFPLYPLLERVFMLITQDPLTAGLIISNVAELAMFVALYRLVEEDFNGERAYRTVLYFSIFPSAFFFSAAYSEALFLCLSVLSFYLIRRRRWWPAGLIGFLACLTRPDGMFLLAPFCYEYLRRRWQEREEPLCSILSGAQLRRLLKSIRFDLCAGLCLPAAIVLYAAYCYYQFHDPLAFVHAHANWSRSLNFPGWGVLKSISEISPHGILSFLKMRNLIDLGADLFIGALIVLGFIGPWRLPKNLWAYGIYALVIYVYIQLFPKDGTLYPLESVSRFVLEIFPAFIVLARIGKHRTLELSYLMLAGALFFFLLTQFLTGHWVV